MVRVEYLQGLLDEEKANEKKPRNGPSTDRRLAEIEIDLDLPGSSLRRGSRRSLHAAVEKPIARCGKAIWCRTLDLPLAIGPLDDNHIAPSE